MAQASLARLDRFLATGGERGVAWKRFLRWNEVQPAVFGGGDPDDALLADVRHRLRAGHEGLELRPFADVAAAFRLYGQTRRLARDSGARTTFETALQTVGQQLAQPSGQWTDEQAEAVAGIVKTEMEGVVDLKVPLVVDTGWGPSWYEAKG